MNIRHDTPIAASRCDCIFFDTWLGRQSCGDTAMQQPRYDPYCPLSRQVRSFRRDHPHKLTPHPLDTNHQCVSIKIGESLQRWTSRLLVLERDVYPFSLLASRPLFSFLALQKMCPHVHARGTQVSSFIFTQSRSLCFSVPARLSATCLTLTLFAHLHPRTTV